MPTIPRKISCSTSTPMNHPQACCCASLTSAPIHITNITIPQATRTNEAIVTPGGGLPAGAPRAIKPVAIPTSTANTHAPMYHRVVIRLLMACLLAPPSPYLGNDSRHGVTYEIESNWQGRKDSNPRPSVLETDALTRLSYAPMRLRKFTNPSNRPQCLPTSIETCPPATCPS